MPIRTRLANYVKGHRGSRSLVFQHFANMVSFHYGADHNGAFRYGESNIGAGPEWRITVLPFTLFSNPPYWNRNKAALV